MTKAADDFETIRRRLEELAAEKNLALTGSTIEEPKIWPMYSAETDPEYLCVWQNSPLVSAD